MSVRSGSKLDRIMERNVSHHRPVETRGENHIFSLHHLVQGPCLASIEMVQSSNDPSGPRLLDVIERNRIIRPKPPPGFLHGLMFSSVSIVTSPNAQCVPSLRASRTRPRKALPCLCLPVSS